MLTNPTAKLIEALEQVQRMIDTASRGKDGRAFVQDADWEFTACVVRNALAEQVSA